MRGSTRLLPALLTAAFVATAAVGHGYKLGKLEIVHPYARATAAMARAGAVYLEIRNHGPADRLLAARTEAAEAAELHSHSNENGVMRMRRVEGGIAVPAGGSVTLAPGVAHVMLLGLKGQLREDELFPLSLIFERAGEIAVEVVVEGIAARQPAPGDYRQEHDHGQKIN